jgi:hypothetical protein
MRVVKTCRFSLGKQVLCFLGMVLPFMAASLDALEAEGDAFFEQHIRPVLVDSCYECHSDQSGESKGGLKLDARPAMELGGQSGPVFVKGKPGESLLIRAMRQEDPDLKMPPKGPKLDDAVIARFEEWIAMGAPDPRDDSDGPSLIELKSEAHWAFQPVEAPDWPEVDGIDWVQRPMDRFVLANLESRQMEPNPETDRRSWIKRVYFNLIGLPPTYEEVEAFLADSSPKAFEKVVEHLLASPHYGERWARHWMDVSRYADTKGYVFTSDRSYPFAYTYRDYLVRAFNEDLPYDQFIREQLAADLLEQGEDQQALAALGYLTLGRRFLNNQNDIIDDRIDVVSRGMMGLTVACARCHEHKYDPIPTEDYYSLYGVFASTHEPEDLPLLGGEPHPRYEDYLSEKKKRRAAYETYLDQAQQDALQSLRDRAGEFLKAAFDVGLIEDRAQKEALARERKLDPGTVQRWVQALERWGEEKHPVWVPWLLATENPDLLGSEKQAEWLALLQDSERVHPIVGQKIRESNPVDLEALSGVYGGLLADVSKEWNELKSKQPDDRELPDPQREALRQVLYASDAPANLPLGELPRLFEVSVGQKVRSLERELDGLDAEHPGAPARAMALLDKDRPVTPVVFLRGSPGNRGPSVPRQFLGFLEGEERQPFSEGSGRLELANKIASPSNPLTARVFVNRVWGWHFGTGLVGSASDFGLRCEEPVQRDLLDYLTASFIHNGWSVKQLQREILLSATFRQSSQTRSDYQLRDPDNRLLWKFNRQRLDLEGTRDTLLKVSGHLDLKMGGKPVEITEAPWKMRRSVYGYIERQNLPNFFRTFDLASPDSSSPGRFRTSVPQQALYMMNSPFLKHVVDGFPTQQQISEQVAGGEDQMITRLYRQFFQRNPSEEELQWGLEFMGATDQSDPSEVVSDRKELWTQYVQTLLMSNELVFVD